VNVDVMACNSMDKLQIDVTPNSSMDWVKVKYALQHLLENVV